jgi:hypothetical protein
VNANLRSLLDPNADITIAPETFQANVSALQPAVAREPVPLPKILDLVSQLFAVEQTPEPAPNGVSALKDWVSQDGIFGVARKVAQAVLPAMIDGELDRAGRLVEAAKNFSVGNSVRAVGARAVPWMRDVAQGASEITGEQLGSALNTFVKNVAGADYELVKPDGQPLSQHQGLEWAALGAAALLPIGPGGKANLAKKGINAGVDAAKALRARGAEVAAKANAKLAEGRVANPLKAYHGSPHDFPPVRELMMPDGVRVYQSLSDPMPSGAKLIKEHPLGRFDMSKIGTGEGAQSYGRGLYFAENPATAMSYRDALSPPGPVLYGGVVVKPTNITKLGGSYGDPVGHAKYIFARYGGNAELSKQTLQTMVESYRAGPYADQSVSRWFEKAVAAIDGLDPASVTRSGRMYEVDLHTDLDALLDWDGPIPAGLQKQLGVRGTVKNGKELYAALHNKAVHASGANKGYKQPGLSDPDGLGSLADRVGVDLAPHQPGSYDDNDFRRIRSEFDNRRKEFTRTEWTKIQAMLDDDADATASTLLREAGVPGLKYFDGASRSAGKGTRNYVVWDEKRIELLRKYGILPPVAAAVAHESIRGGKKKDQ